MAVSVRNAQYREDGLRIKCEVSVDGGPWKPYTADPNDPEPLGIAIHAAALSLNPAPYAPVLSAITADHVKAEAQRRILEILPEWKQRNLTAQAAVLAEKGRANWTSEELAAWTAGEAVWNVIVAIRAASDLIELDVPIPQDYATDARWPT